MTDALKQFVQNFSRLTQHDHPLEETLLSEGTQLLRELIATDAWLPAAYAEPNEQQYRQYLLHCDPLERFSVVSFVWRPGQKTPVHDHTVWGLVGQLRGEEISQHYSRSENGPQLIPGQRRVLQPGDIETLSPRIGDIHQVSCGERGTAISIHVYGANIGRRRRHTFDLDTGTRKPFISGYHNETLPNVWR